MERLGGERDRERLDGERDRERFLLTRGERERRLRSSGITFECRFTSNAVVW